MTCLQKDAEVRKRRRRGAPKGFTILVIVVLREGEGGRVLGCSMRELLRARREIAQQGVDGLPIALQTPTHHRRTKNNQNNHPLPSRPNTNTHKNR